MLLYEICRRDLAQLHGGDINKAIQAGDYIPRDSDFIRAAFNNGRGTVADMNRYMRDNSIFCVWYDPKTRQLVKKIQEGATA